jgi:Flp pilus assembly protein TadD
MMQRSLQFSLVGTLLLAGLVALSPQAGQAQTSDGAAPSESTTNRDQNLDTLFEQGRKLVEAKDWTGALDVFEQAAVLDSKNARVFSGIGYVQAQRGSFEEAAAAYRHAIELDPHNADFELVWQT